VGGVEQVALGGGHSCVRTKSGNVYCWGRNGSGQLGVQTTEGQSEFPLKVKLDGDATLLAAGTYHTCAVVEERLFCWGKNDDGQIGNGNTNDALAPAEVTGIDQPIEALALGEAHSCAIAGGGRLFCWGASGLGQAGMFGGQVLVPTFVEANVSGVAAGSFHTCFIGAGGLVRCMGANTDGECGQPGPVSQVLPPLVPAGLEGAIATRIASGPGRHTCAEVEGELACWGDNSTGQLGIGFITDNEGATLLQGVPGGQLRGFAPGTTHTCALWDDDVYCWGDNFSGQLGIAGSERVNPTATGLSGIVAVGSGSVHSCAYKSPTEIWCWGTNAFGQLGNGETSSMTSLPVQVELP
jgi:alpha-tubulin suppressor-like RCC1 family protein